MKSWKHHVAHYNSYLSRTSDHHEREHGLSWKDASSSLKWFRKNKVISTLTYMVKTITMTIIEIPQWSGKSLIRCLATNIQKTTTGARMRNIVRNKDLTSGPNMNRPCKKNSWKEYQLLSLKKIGNLSGNSCEWLYKKEPWNIWRKLRLQTVHSSDTKHKYPLNTYPEYMPLEDEHITQKVLEGYCTKQTITPFRTL